MLVSKTWSGISLLSGMNAAFPGRVRGWQARASSAHPVQQPPHFTQAGAATQLSVTDDRSARADALVRRCLGVSVNRDVSDADANMPLQELGMDSLVAVGFRSALSDEVWGLSMDFGSLAESSIAELASQIATNMPAPEMPVVNPSSAARAIATTAMPALAVTDDRPARADA
eukprot:CAMPEP_0203842896 /NCGR_PEP_ID=MMETSP0359-20131031/2272_1 /ASSEMBLY_ACC=CAM_ASM_000338 /TAXON_ID=268821 /ORGANISM="Scrippsiella Hangoei, Strain SHTV-5" /LENGTH=171 /DNA_ID=CAMNT_0050757575 /DNA_START=297 /DNA_END=809 /DNA_ORIENTATION=+